MHFFFIKLMCDQTFLWLLLFQKPNFFIECRLINKYREHLCLNLQNNWPNLSLSLSLSLSLVLSKNICLIYFFFFFLKYQVGMGWILNQPDTQNRPNSFCVVVVVGFSNFIKRISYNLYLTSQSISIMLGANFGKELIFCTCN